ncbi:MAG: hypothetical protein K8H99_10955, partial [Nitrospirae bacterium]|nr:hypothetical protein [Fimbriimonadaceae bacterium]
MISPGVEFARRLSLAFLTQFLRPRYLLLKYFAIPISWRVGPRLIVDIVVISQLVCETPGRMFLTFRAIRVVDSFFGVGGRLG